MRRIVCWTLLVAGAGPGCGRAHLTETHGRSSRAVFAVQDASAGQARRAEIPPGLDSQEAGIIAESYRKSLAPKGTAVDEQPAVMILQEPSGPKPAPLAPSVPRP